MHGYVAGEEPSDCPSRKLRAAFRNDDLWTFPAPAGSAASSITELRCLRTSAIMRVAATPAVFRRRLPAAIPTRSSIMIGERRGRDHRGGSRAFKSMQPHGRVCSDRLSLWRRSTSPTRCAYEDYRAAVMPVADWRMAAKSLVADYASDAIEGRPNEVTVILEWPRRKRRHRLGIIRPNIKQSSICGPTTAWARLVTGRSMGRTAMIYATLSLPNHIARKDIILAAAVMVECPR